MSDEPIPLDRIIVPAAVRLARKNNIRELYAEDLKEAVRQAIKAPEPNHVEISEDTKND